MIRSSKKSLCGGDKKTMTFHSVNYIVFLTICICLYYLVAEQWRWCVLLVFSCYFYASWNAVYFLLIAFVASIAYLAGRWIEKNQSKNILIASMCAVFLCLFVFKYYNFAAENINALLAYIASEVALPKSRLLLPVGISFYTFQAGSYLVDVYTGKIAAEKNFFKFALYLTFFPQLVAGPIERAELFLPQITKKHAVSYEMMRTGLQQILIGMFKKIVMADTLAVFVDGIYENASNCNGATLFIAAILFSLQIYGDFSGYSDIAVGSARLFGYQLSENFRQPYFAVSIKDFWSRWHRTLTGWFRDYIYIPLGGGRVGLFKKCRNIAAVFLLSGIWHGSAWTFLAWGGVHAICRMIEEIYEEKVVVIAKNRSMQMKALKIVFTFVLVSILWIFFRAETMSDAIYMISHMFTGWDITMMSQELQSILYVSMFRSQSLLIYTRCIVGLSIAIVCCFGVCKEQEGVLLFEKLGFVSRWGLYIVMSVVTIFHWLLLNGIYGQTGAFIYFQF